LQELQNDAPRPHRLAPCVRRRVLPPSPARALAWAPPARSAPAARCNGAGQGDQLNCLSSSNFKSPTMSRFRSLQLLAAACALTTLAGCAALSPAPVAAYREQVELSGRLSVIYQKGGQPESLSGRFSWAQTPARVDLSLDSPLGQTVARISVTPQAATLTQAGQAPRTAPDIDTLSAQTLGWSLPVSGLRDWLQGYATGAGGARFVASPANNSVTTADGWRLRFVSWQDEAAARPQPKRIDAERSAGPDASEMTLRIVLDPQA
jgi:outer membrane lipoprotein LolB